jgi:glycerophosphoryl diester phosphodiesterase
MFYNVAMFERVPLIIGHRGAAAILPENTMESFHLAFDSYHADMVEFDIHRSKEGTPIIIHDARLERTTNGQGYVSHFSLEELKRWDAGFNFDPHSNKKYPERGKQMRIPTFEELLSAYGHKTLSVEIKEKSASLTHDIMKLIKHYKREKNCVVGSKYEVVSKTMRENYPNVYRFWSKAEIVKAYIDFQTNGNRLSKDPYAVASMPAESCGMHFHSAEFIAYLHKLDVKSFFWTINNPEMMKRLKANGADGIITDDPGLARDVLL